MSRHELKECSDFYEKKCKTLLKNTRDLHMVHFTNAQTPDTNEYIPTIPFAFSVIGKTNL